MELDNILAVGGEATLDPKRIVEGGFDRIARRHAEWATCTRTEERERYLAAFCGAVPPGARVLDLGCGAGGLVTRELSSRYSLTGVDLSARSIDIVREFAPGAKFVHGDMSEVDFPPQTFTGVTAFYSIIHVPREEQGPLLRRIAKWLHPGGIFVGTLGASDDEAGFEEDWLGAPMYWSSYDAATERRLVEESGLRIDQAAIETADEDGTPTSFLWVVARRPLSGADRGAEGAVV